MMTQDLIQRTVRDWVMVDPARGARELNRLSNASGFREAKSAEDITEALIQLAGRMEIAETRLW